MFKIFYISLQMYIATYTTLNMYANTKLFNIDEVMVKMHHVHTVLRCVLCAPAYNAHLILKSDLVEKVLFLYIIRDTFAA